VPGLYWVIPFVRDKWEPARWTGDTWHLLGSDVDQATVFKIGKPLGLPKEYQP
jgi:hypothetical protein